MTNEENKVNMQNNIQMGIIIVLLVVVAVMGFFLLKNSPASTGTIKNTTGVTQSGAYENLAITVYEDKRCTECPTDQVVQQLKLLPSVSGVDIVRKDFSEKGVSDYLKSNNITALPLIVFSTNNFDVSKDPEQKDQSGNPIPKVNTFLKPLSDGGYTLEIGATFNPFKERSKNGLLLIDKNKLKEIKESSFVKGNKDAKITWLEYSDLECPFCAKLHKSTTKEELIKKYGDKLNIVFNNYPLPFHNNAEPAAEILKCVGELKGSDAYYSLIDTSYGHAKQLDTGNIDTSESSSKKYLVEEAVKLGVSEADLNKCLDSGKYKDVVKKEMEVGSSEFGVTGTPGSILINNETGEYEVISGAYPTDAFTQAIDKLLGETK